MDDQQGGRLLAEEPGGVRVSECSCGNHYHVRVGKTTLTLERDELLSLLRALTDASRQIEEEEGPILPDPESSYPVQ